MSEKKSTENDKIELSANPTTEETTISIKKSTYNNMLKGIVIAIAAATFLGGYFVGAYENTDSISSEDIKEILGEIEKQAAPAPQLAPQPTQQPSAPSAPQIFKISLDDDPIKGDPNAPITIVEFSDFQCPFCSRFFTQTLPQLEETYIDTGIVKLVYRDLPLDSLHPNARPASIASECADEQGKFWDYHDVLFSKQAEWGRQSTAVVSETFQTYASDLGLEAASFETCLSSSEMVDEVNNDYLDATSYGASGTPTFFVGTEKDGFIKLVGAQPFNAFKLNIDRLLES